MGPIETYAEVCERLFASDDGDIHIARVGDGLAAVAAKAAMETCCGTEVGVCYKDGELYTYYADFGH